MKFIAIVVFTLLLSPVYSFYEVEGVVSESGKITGKVVDENSGAGVEYATIALYRKSDDKLITGGITNSDGIFNIKADEPGEYYITVTFLGFHTKIVQDIVINHGAKHVNVGKVILSTNAKELDGVDVIAEQSAISYKIDKKVINVSQQLTAKSGSAVDILENVPSVRVDIDGNVTLRGSASFTVLIDGRPTSLSASDALAQIPASAIENIEIITNPSAKYEPDGASGIINIVTKKNRLQGVSGIANINIGRFSNYGGDVTVDIRRSKLHYYIGGNYNYRNRPGTIEYSRNVFYEDNNNYHVLSDGDFARSAERYSFKGGGDYRIEKKSVIGVNFRVGNRDAERSMQKNYEEFYDNDISKNFYLTDDVNRREGMYWDGNINYKINFNKEKTHLLEMQVQVNGSESDELNENMQTYTDGSIATASRSTETGPSNSIRIKADYTRPLEWGGKLEAGWQSYMNNSDDYNKVYDYDTVSNEYVFQDKYSNHTSYTRNTHAGYATLGGERGNIGYQAGLRMEYTYRLLSMEERGEEYKIDRIDFFPTMHISYKLPSEQQVMVSYTRRIDRPRGYQLEPFITYSDAYNVRKGNPDLLPEYINSFDLSYQKKLGRDNFVSAEGYYRITENKTERVMSPFEDDSTMLMHTYQNVGKDYSLGMEFMINYYLAKWYNVNIMADLYDYRMEGSYDDIDFEQHNFSWNIRFNNSFKIAKNSKFQFNMMYQSSSVRAQGTSEGFFYSTAAYKQDFFDRKLSTTLQVRDVFGTWKHEYNTQGIDFDQHTLFQPTTPFVTISISYKINNYRVKNGDKGGSGMDDGGEIL